MVELLGRLGDDSEIADQIEEARHLRESLATLQDEIHGLRQAAKAGEKAQADLRELQESLEAQRSAPKAVKMGHWAGIVAKAPHLHGALEAAVKTHASGRPVVGLPPALTNLRVEAGSWAAALAAIQAVPA